MILADTDPVTRPDINALITEGLDPQLETALLLLRAQAVSRILADHRHASID